MRTIIVTPLYPPDLGDLAVYVKNVAIHLSKTDDVVIATYSESPEDIEGVPIVTTSKRLPTITRLAIFTFRLWKAAKNADILYVGDGASVGLPSVIVSFLRRVPMVRFVLQDETWERAFHAKIATTDEASFILSKQTGRLAWIKRLQSIVLRSAKLIFVSSAFYQSLFKKGYGVDAIVLTYPADKPLELPFAAEPVAHQLLITHDIARGSGFEQAFAAIAERRSTFSDIKLIIANTGRDQHYYQQLAQTLGIAEHIVFLGHVSRAEQEDLARNSEAQLILSTDTTSIRSLNNASAQGIAIITNDSSDLSVRIQRLFTDPAYKAELVADARRVATEQASWDSHLAHWHSAIKKIL